MNNNLLRQLVFCTKQTIKYFLLQLLVLQVVLAEPSSSQSMEDYQVTLNVTDQKLVEVLAALEKQTDFVFAYNQQVAKDKSRITIANTSDLKTILQKITEQVDFDFKRVNNNIYVTHINSRLKIDEKIKYEEDVISSRNDVLITGKVTDGKGEPLPGVSVIIEGTTKGTVTDIDGNYSIDVSEGGVLLFSFIGYVPQRVRITNQTELSISLMEDNVKLSEVVVTAFGLERNEKSISYSYQKIDGDRLVKAKNPNFGAGLQGKIAGLSVVQRSGAPGESPSINIRGSRSITGNNEPLYVVDGFPISGRIVDLNPNDIETINVLKGPTAAALYGIRASNGVIVVTTKRGAEAGMGKPRITFDKNVTYDVLTRFPNLQKTYGQGELGAFIPFSTFNWGPRIDTLGTYTNQLGQPEQAAVYDNPGNFFNNGRTYNVNLDVSNRFEKGNYSVGVGYINQEGTIEGTSFERYNFKVASDYNLSSKVRIGTSVNFSSANDSRVVDGAGNSSLFYAAFFAPVTYDLRNKPISQPDDPFNQINFRGGHDNIYWSIKNNSNTGDVLRTFGNTYLEYKPVDWITLNTRLGVDYLVSNRKNVLSLGSGATGGRTNPPRGGQITDFNQNQRQFNAVTTLVIDKQIHPDLRLNFIAGNEYLDFNSRQMVITGNDIVIGGFDHISNTSLQIPNENVNRSRLVGFFSNAELAYKNYLFFNASVRNDIVSNMPRGNRSFVYPSVGMGFVFTDAFNIESNILTFGKIRGSIAEVGQAGPLYVGQNVFVRGMVAENFGAGAFQFPFLGLPAFMIDRNQVSNIEPENIKTNEIGFDLRFFNNRLGIDYSYYETSSEGQIFRVPLPPSTGFGTELRNSGIMSVKGHEVVLNINPIRKTDFSWDITTNFTAFKNEVVELAEGIERLTLGGFRAQIVAERGLPYPSLLGSSYARDANDNVVVDSRQFLPNGNANPAYGMPLRSLEQNTFLGQVNPDFEIGFINQFQYKQFSLAIQVDWRQGGFISSGSNRLGKLYGSLDVTGNRETPQIYDGSKGFYDVAGNLVVEGVNDIPIIQGQHFFRNVLDPIIESNVYDASFVRLREIRLSYDLSPDLLKRIGFQNASFYVVGRNLWLNAALPNFDPEMVSGSGNVRGEEYLVVPQTASYGAGLVVSF
ncbi:SusC/RagA family TonB-linked outer membrane protein [Aquiflexum sp.]|uniref:SusC/RagA family TonB-linked outer membrane protein n=1 Tax=Aquiflexum sp. TaxID=1872584 RepID=UPI003593B76A